MENQINAEVSLFNFINDELTVVLSLSGNNDIAAIKFSFTNSGFNVEMTDLMYDGKQTICHIPAVNDMEVTAKVMTAIMDRFHEGNETFEEVFYNKYGHTVSIPVKF